MTQSVVVKFFDAHVQHATQATLTRLDTANSVQLCVHFDNQERRYLLTDAEFIPAVANIPDIIEFRDGARIEFLQAAPAWLRLRDQKFFGYIYKLETSFKWMLASAIMMAVLVFGAIKFGIPSASHYLAFHLPDDTLMQIGDDTEQLLYQMTEPSELSNERQTQIRNLYYQLNPAPRANIIMRHGGDDLGANAFAIPNNTIIITDELVNLSDDDREILAVLAHEQGHLVHRHSLQQAINGIGLGVLFMGLTGETSDLIAALPTLFTTMQYSQTFEMQADNFAIDELKRLGVSPVHLANFFRNIQKEEEEEDTEPSHPIWSVLSTHPNPQKRIDNAEKRAEE